MSDKSSSGCLPVIIIMALFIGGFSYFYIESEKKKELTAAAEEAEHKQILNTIETTAQKFNADVFCNDALVQKNDDAIFNDKIMTVDVQKCWIQNRPIVFRGELTDVALLDNDNYTIFIKSDAIGSLTKLNLVLSCKKDIVDIFRDQAKRPLLKKESWERDFDTDGVAAIAKIQKISTGLLDEKENKTDAKIGYGDCLALVPDEGKLKKFFRSQVRSK